MRPEPISPEFIIKQKNASGSYKYLTGSDRVRSHVKIDLSFSGAFLRLQMQREFLMK